jgi:hypothetical protein
MSQRSILTLAFTLALSCTAPSAEAPVNPEGSEAVLAAAQALFDALHNRDSAAIVTLMTPHGRFVVPTDLGIRESSAEQMGAAISAGTEVLMERMWDPEVRIEGLTATVWTPYDFYRDGEFSHCGIDAFQLVKLNGQWKIASVMYTRQTEGCDSPLGPP